MLPTGYSHLHYIYLHPAINKRPEFKQKSQLLAPHIFDTPLLKNCKATKLAIHVDLRPRDATSRVVTPLPIITHHLHRESTTSLQQVTGTEQGKKEDQAAVDEYRLLPGRHSVGSKPVAHVLLKTGDLLGSILEGSLFSPTDWALPVLG
jgi:hypothetical protein